ncbi:hypothetical protein GBAR_LOCUS14998 [Geodia barretti]|uniref:Putative restriction endonuclease domain-containing protein n=1 Tax=Geodia barretti TaxID=519541 RepID=A0AA35WTJ7_GEOBA|nr:hypothetical protein GBAR_LOCUS14998 [Geodia barretti]
MVSSRVTTQSKKPAPYEIHAEQDPVVPEPLGPIVLKLDPVLRLTGELLLELCSLNDAVRIELNAKQELELLPPANPSSSNQNANISVDLGNWARANGTGLGSDSYAGFTPPNGAVRSPDASWILKERCAEIPDKEKHKFTPIVPDFVVELRSPSDSLRGIQAKLEEYIAHGVRLGWLIDLLDPRHRVYVYRPNAPVEVREGPETLSGDPELPGFVLDLQPVWGPAL